MKDISSSGKYKGQQSYSGNKAPFITEGILDLIADHQPRPHVQKNQSDG